ncbi:MAG: VWA domain-containing protein [Burkholderiales bacterium]|nr:VWA domain-containing protein [Burkholderiales bacterium]
MPAGRLAENIAHFARVLRAAGLPVGPDRVVSALQALAICGIAERARVHAALAAVLIDRREHQAIFDAAFDAFWRDPRAADQIVFYGMPQAPGSEEEQKRRRRLDDALQPAALALQARDDAAEEPETVPDAALSFSARERLQSADFESMTAAEFALARKLAERLPLPIPPLATRRWERAARGTLDLRVLARQGARDPFGARLAWRRRALREAPLVVLIDISGSMQRYSRIFLHWVHALMRVKSRVAVFTLGTRLTPVTRCLLHRDPDDALAAAGAAVRDWNGGTRLATCLALFNRLYARRVLTGNAAVLLLTDGLERDEAGTLGAEAARLARLARRIVWLNPLLRYDGFEPRAAGIRAILPHVDAFLPAHNLASLADLAGALGAGAAGTHAGISRRRGAPRAAGRAPPGRADRNS